MRTQELLSRMGSVAEVVERLQGASELALGRQVRAQRTIDQTLAGLGRWYEGWPVDVAAMSSRIELTRIRLSTMDLAAVGQLIDAGEQQRDALARLTRRLVTNHADLVASVGQTASLSASSRLAAFDLPTRGVFLHTSAVRSITPHEPLEDDEEGIAVPLSHATISQTDGYLERKLSELKPAFLEQYRGVKERSQNPGPDGWTQGSASMRKLLKGVLHSVAPNSAVLPWAKRNKKELDRNGRPTRATKIEWLCRSIPDETYRNFVRTELESALALIKVVDTAQHVDEFPEFAEQYDWITARTAVCVRHMLVLWNPSR